MKLTILGTGNATVTECYNTCFALSDGNRHFLVDTGGGNRILKVLKRHRDLAGRHSRYFYYPWTYRSSSGRDLADTDDRAEEDQPEGK